MKTIKIQTVIILPNGNEFKRINDFLYSPLDCIVINNREYYKWNQYDEFINENVLKRTIRLKD